MRVIIHRLGVLLVALIVASGALREATIAPDNAFRPVIQAQRGVDAIDSGLPVSAGALRAGTRVESGPVGRTSSDWAVVPAVRVLAPVSTTFSPVNHAPAKVSSLVLPGAGVRAPPSKAL